jgi:hypothetical protein
MDEDTYLELLNFVSPVIGKEDTVMGTAVSVHERLGATLTLRFLATGTNYEDLVLGGNFSRSTREFFPQTCTAIYKVLRKEYCKVNHEHLFKYLRLY